MSREDKEWLILEFPNFRPKVKKGDVFRAYLKAEMLLNGWDKIKERGCKCNIPGVVAAVDSKYDRWVKKQSL